MRIRKLVTAGACSLALTGCSLMNNPQTMLALGKEIGAAKADQQIMASELRAGLSGHWQGQAAESKAKIESIRQSRGRQAEALGILTWDRAESINNQARTASRSVDQAVANNIGWLEGTLQGTQSATRALETVEAVFSANNEAEADIRNHAAKIAAELAAAKAALESIRGNGGDDADDVVDDDDGFGDPAVEDKRYN